MALWVRVVGCGNAKTGLPTVETVRRGSVEPIQATRRSTRPPAMDRMVGHLVGVVENAGRSGDGIRSRRLGALLSPAGTNASGRRSRGVFNHFGCT
jgi:hypothetical protein